MNVLIACEFSGRVRDAFTARGHNAWSCDLLPSETPGKHIIGDAADIAYWGCWDLMIAHPPCQYLSYAGNRHWNLPGRAELRQQAMDFFMRLVNAPIERICVENPRGYPMRAYRKADQEIHPYYFGDPFMKRTCLWLKNLPLLSYDASVTKPAPLTNDVGGKKAGINRHFTEATRNQKERSKTFPAIARALAEQWG